MVAAARRAWVACLLISAGQGKTMSIETEPNQPAEDCATDRNNNGSQDRNEEEKAGDAQSTIWYIYSNIFHHAAVDWIGI